MKKYIWILLLVVYVPSWSKAQSEEVQQLLLDVEKLAQLKQMLADLKKGYEIVYKGYSSIKNISEGNFNLHQVFFGWPASSKSRCQELQESCRHHFTTAKDCI